MKKIEITGWKEVFFFTLQQTVKSKSYLITLFVFCLAAAVGLPAYSYFSGDSQMVNADIDTEEFLEEDLSLEDGSDDASEKTSKKTELKHLKKIWFHYEKENALDDLVEKFAGKFNCLTEYLETGDVEKTESLLNENSDSCILHIRKEKGVYSMEVVHGWNVTKLSSEIDQVTDWFSERLGKLQRASVISEEYLKEAEKEVTAYIDGEEKTEDGAAMQKYYISLVFIMLLTFTITFAGQSIANSIIVEKSSKLVEYLLLSVRPMAIVAGKVLAAVCSLLLQLGAMFLSGMVSAILSGKILSMSVWNGVSSLWKDVSGQSVFAGAGAFTVLLIIFIVLFGILFFSVIAAIAGASVSKIEESQEGMLFFTLLVIIGCYAAIAMSMGNMIQGGGENPGALVYFCSLCPVTSVFFVPAQLMMGRISVLTGIASLLFLLAGIYFMWRMAAKIYEYLLFYNGVVLKPKDIIYIMRHGKSKEDK